MSDTSKIATDARPILERARAAMSGLTTVEAAITEVAEQLRQARASVRPEEAVVDVALEAVLDGDPVPADLADRVLQIRRSNEATLATAQILGPVERRLEERLQAVHRTRADDALTVLATELDAALTAASPVLARLGSVDDADTAITSGRVNEWKEAGHLATRYAAVRDAQRIVVAAALDPPDQARLTARVSPAIRSLVDDYGHIRQPDRHHATVGTGGSGSGEVRVGQTRIFSGRLVVDSHVDRPVRPRPWTTGDVLSDLRFVCRDDVEPWVPTINELTGARDEHQSRMQTEARAEAERRPGDDDPRLAPGRRMPPPPAALLDRLAREELGEPA